MSLFGRLLDVDGDSLTTGTIFDTVLTADGDLYSAVKSNAGTVSLTVFENARGDGTFLGTLPLAGGRVDLFNIDGALGTVLRTPGPDSFANSTIVYVSADPSDVAGQSRVELVSARVTDPKTALSDAGFAIVYENSALARGDEIVQFHTPDGTEINQINIGALLESDILGLDGGEIVVFGEDSTSAFFRRFEGNGDEIGARVEVAEVGASAPLKNGGFLHATPDEAGVITLRQYKADGSQKGSAIKVDTDTPDAPAYEDGDLTVFETKGGLYALAYQAPTLASNGFSTTDEVYVTLVDRRGEVVDGPVQFDSASSGITANPDFLALKNGNTLFSYSDQGFPRGITGQVIEAPDRVKTGNGKDQNTSGTNGQDLISGLGGEDTLKGGKGADTLFGGDGDDRALGGAGSDRTDGGAGADKLLGQNGNDILLGGLGGDTLEGGKGADTLFGGGGSDVENGGGGADTFWSSGGNDTLKGQGGADTFVYHEDGFGKDEIIGFGGKDVLDFSAFSASEFEITARRGDVTIKLDTNNRVTIEDATLQEVQDALIFL